jgi:Tfp pilus assembly protein PilX
VKKKSVILITVMGIFITFTILALVALYLMTQHSRIAEYKIRRMRAIFAAKAGLIHALERLREGDNPNDINGTITIGSHPYPLDVNITITGSVGDYTVNATVEDY